MGATATRDAVLAEVPDLVVCATGATPLPPEFSVEDGARVITVWDLLGGAVDGRPERAVVVDDGGGFWHGVSAAELLAVRGAAVELVTGAHGVALAIPHESAGNVMRRLRGGGVRFRTGVKVTRCAGTALSLADVVTGEAVEGADADLVVVRTRLRANDDLARELDGEVPALALIGDCSSPRRLTHAVLDANSALRHYAEGRLSSSPQAVY
jgi:2,4-dienoyl-CoA reductase (NADPH2)